MPADQIDNTIQPIPLEQKRPIRAFEGVGNDALFGGGKKANDLGLEAGEAYDAHYQRANMLQATGYMDQITRYKLDQLNNQDYGVMHKNGNELTQKDLEDRTSKFESYISDLASKAPNSQLREYITGHGGEQVNDLYKQYGERASKELQQQGYANAMGHNQTLMDDAQTKVSSGQFSILPNERDKDGNLVIGKKSSLEEYDMKITANARLAGLTGEQQQSQVDDFHSRLLKQFINKGAIQDANYLFSHATFNAQESASLSGMLEKATDRYASIHGGDRALAESGGDFVGAGKKVDSSNMTEGQKEDAKKYLITKQKQNEELSKLQNDKTTNGLYDALQKWQKENPGKTETIDDLAVQGVIKQTDLDSISDKSKQGLEKFLNPEKNQVKADVTFKKFNDEFIKNPQAIKNLQQWQLNEYYKNDTDSEHAARIQEMWKTAQGNGEKTVRALIPVQMIKDRIEEMNPGLSTDPERKEDYQDMLAQAEARVYREAEDTVTSNGGKLSQSEADEIVDNEMKRTYDKRGLLGTTTATPNFLFSKKDVISDTAITKVKGYNGQNWFDAMGDSYTEDQKIRMWQIISTIKSTDKDGSVDLNNLSLKQAKMLQMIRNEGTESGK